VCKHDGPRSPDSPRAWHWREALFYRAAAKRCKVPYARNRNDGMADAHICHVITLNDYFPAGDTAEADCMEGRA
jgi:hypothetical protein